MFSCSIVQHFSSPTPWLFDSVNYLVVHSFHKLSRYCFSSFFCEWCSDVVLYGVVTHDFTVFLDVSLAIRSALSGKCPGRIHSMGSFSSAHNSLISSCSLSHTQSSSMQWMLCIIYKSPCKHLTINTQPIVWIEHNNISFPRIHLTLTLFRSTICAPWLFQP